MDNFLQLLGYSDLTVLSIRQVGAYHKITNIMEFPSDTGSRKIMYVFHLYAGRDLNGDLCLYNPLPINSKLLLNSTRVEPITYYYPKDHTFNPELAKKQSDFVVGFAQQYDLPLPEIDYYFAPSQEEINRIRGFDFLIGDNAKQYPSGKADHTDNKVYVSGLDEYYPHELIHILVNPHYPNCHLWINEGLATYYGLSRGKTLVWHIRRLSQFVEENPDVDFTDMLQLKTLDQQTDFRYVLGGIIIREADNLGGVDQIKRLLEGGKSEADFYATLERELDWKRENLNQIIRDRLYLKD